MRGSVRQSLVGTVVLMLALAGCSSSNDDSAEIEALTEQVQELQTQLEAPTSTTTAQEQATTSIANAV